MMMAAGEKVENYSGEKRLQEKTQLCCFVYCLNLIADGCCDSVFGAVTDFVTVSPNCVFIQNSIFKTFYVIPSNNHSCFIQ